MSRPILLTADRFTSQAKTPWGGDAITRVYKRAILPKLEGQRVGEAWEFSCDPDFPSLCDGGGTLPEFVAANREAVFSGSGLAHSSGEVEILVKLLDAADVLSVQVHPRDDDVDLKPGECGKPESWYVLSAKPGAGLYLGFSRATSKDELRKAFQSGGPEAKALMQFVPVQPGDYFEIEPGVPHAIGGGVTLVEPQRILPGKSGKTYRFWDWGRYYLPDGRQASQGEPGAKPRELHLEAGLKLVSPDRQVGEPFVRSLRRFPKRTDAGGGTLISQFPANPWYQLTEVDLGRDGAAFELAMTGYGALTVLSGTVRLSGAFGETFIQGCRSALLPQNISPVRVLSTQGSARCILLTPAWSQTSFSP